MTTLALVDLTCAVCGELSHHNVTRSSNSFGMDLDGRPGGMIRETNWDGPLSCPKCGYTFINIEFEPPAGVVDSPEYRELVGGDAGSWARDWAACAMIFMAFGDKAWAAVCYQNAAWRADDAESAEEAREFRLKAMDLVTQMIAEESIPQDGLAEAYAVMADMCRRNGDFDEAARFVDEALKWPVEAPWGLILEEQRVYISAEDTDVHAVDWGPTIWMHG